VHVHAAGHGRGHGVDAGEKFCKEKGGAASLVKVGGA
jgi:hypothetical protein